jgi:hypothetical protein
METPELPDLSHLFPATFFQRLTNVVFGVGRYPSPVHGQITSATRLLDKALVDWDLARKEFADHIEIRGGIPQGLRPREPGITRAYFRGIGHLESVIDSFDRALRLIRALENDDALEEFAGMELPSAAECKVVRDFRNRIAHADEDLAEGIAGQGEAMMPATLSPSTRTMTIEKEAIDYQDLARMLETVYEYLKAVIWRGVQPARSHAD